MKHGARLSALLLFALLLSALLSFAQSEEKKLKLDPKPSPAQVLKEAYDTAFGLSPDDRVAFLIELISGAEALNMKEGAEWSLESFALTRQMLPGQHRTASQKNSLAALSHWDAVKAAEMYTQQDPMPPLEIKFEDPRAYSTRVLFPRLWDKLGIASVPGMERICAWLTESGQYPYYAMAGIILNVAEKVPDEAKLLYSRAVSYLASDSGFLSTNRQYVEFLLKTSAVPGPDLLRTAIQQGLDSIALAAKDDKRPKMSFSLRAGKTQAGFDSEADYLVYRLSPLILSLDPKWLAKVQEDYPALRGSSPLPADAKPAVSAVISTSPDVSPDRVRRAMDESRLDRIGELADSNPKEALQLAMQIADPEQRSLAFTTLAGSKSQPADSGKWLEDAAKRLETMEPGIMKLRLLLQIAAADFSMKREKDAEALLNRALDLGGELVEQDLRTNPGIVFFSAKGLEPMTRAAELAAKKSAAPYDVLSGIRQVPDQQLRATLLVAFGKGLGSASGPEAN